LLMLFKWGLVAFLLLVCSSDAVSPHGHHSHGVVHGHGKQLPVLLNEFGRRSKVQSNEGYSSLPDPRPERDDDEPVIVKVFAEPIYVYDVQQLDCYLHLSMLLEMSWYDDDMAFIPSPDLLVKNTKRRYHHSSSVTSSSSHTTFLEDTAFLEESVNITASAPVSADEEVVVGATDEVVERGSAENILDEGILEEEYDEEDYDPKKHMLAEEAYESGEDIGDPVRIDSNGNWSPGMEVMNQIEPLSLVEIEEMVHYPSGMVEFSRRINVKTVADFDFHHFPFDVHTLDIRFTAFGYSAEEVLLVTDKSKLSSNFDITQHNTPEFLTIGWTCEDELIHTAFEDQDSMFSCFLTVQRNNANVLTITVFPEILIVLFALSAFFIRGDKSDIRIGITSTSMLTIMAFLFVVSSELPQISYLTWLHYYSFLCFVFVFNVMCCVVWLEYMDPDGRAFQQQIENDAHEQERRLSYSGELGDDLEKDGDELLPQKKYLSTGGYDIIKIDRHFRIFLPIFFAIVTIIAIAVEMENIIALPTI